MRTTKCLKCGAENNATDEVCVACGAVLKPDVSNETTGNSMVKKYKNLKQYSLGVKGGGVNIVRATFIIMYLLGIASIIFAVKIFKSYFISDSEGIIAMIHGVAILAMAIWLHITYSPDAAFVTFLLCYIEIICFLIFLRRLPWFIAVDCVLSLIAFFVARELETNYYIYSHKSIGRKESTKTEKKQNERCGLKRYSLSLGVDIRVRSVQCIITILYIFEIGDLIYFIGSNFPSENFFDEFPENLNIINSLLEMLVFIGMTTWFYATYSPDVAVVTFWVLLVWMIQAPLYNIINIIIQSQEVLQEFPNQSFFDIIFDLIAQNEKILTGIILKTLLSNLLYIILLRKLIKNAESLQTSYNQSLKNPDYSEQAKITQEEKVRSISLKSGYQFALVPSRIFAEKTDEPGNYLCPYCYAQVSSDVASMCGNCGKSLGADSTVSFVPNESIVAASDSVPSSETEPIVKNPETEEPKESPVDKTSESKKASSKNKKLFIGIAAGAAVLIVGLAVTLILVINKKNGAESIINTWNDSYAKEYSYEQPNVETDLYTESLDESYTSETTQPEADDVDLDIILQCVDNLRLRESENLDSSVILTMNAGTKVKIIKIGRQDESDGISSNWVQVEVLPGGKDKDFNRIPNGTRGWCFGGYLESCSN